MDRPPPGQDNFGITPGMIAGMFCAAFVFGSFLGMFTFCYKW